MCSVSGQGQGTCWQTADAISHAHIADVEEQALEVRELRWGESEQAGFIVEDGASDRLIRLESIWIMKS